MKFSIQLYIFHLLFVHFYAYDLHIYIAKYCPTLNHFHLWAQPNIWSFVDGSVFDSAVGKIYFNFMAGHKSNDSFQCMNEQGHNNN